MAAKKGESWMGIALTALLCVVFLYWWMRQGAAPQGAKVPETVSEMVAEARRETVAAKDRAVVDMDLMEVAMLLASVQQLDPALEAAGGIRTPVVRRVAARFLAQAWLISDPKDLGQAMRMESLLPLAEERDVFRAGVLEQLARLDFAQAGVAAAVTPAQKARMGRILAEVGDGEEVVQARAFLHEISGVELSAEGQEDRVMLEVHLARGGKLDEALAAIKTLPEQKRREAWVLLFRLVEGPERVGAVLGAIDDAQLRLQLEIEALGLNRISRSAAEVVATAKERVAAVDTEARVGALLDLSDAWKGAGDDEAALATLAEARQEAEAIPLPRRRCEALVKIARVLADDARLPAATACLDGARRAALSLSAQPERAEALSAVAVAFYQQGRPQEAGALAMEAYELARSGALDVKLLGDLVVQLFTMGEWDRAHMLVAGIHDEAQKAVVMERICVALAEQALTYDPEVPPHRGEYVDAIRNHALEDPERAAQLVEAQASGTPKARAWLALARAMITGRGLADLGLPMAPPAAAGDGVAQ